MEKVHYGGWPNCYRLANDTVELIVTTDIGPRIIRFGFVGGQNELKEYPETLGQVGGDTWHLYGGHRLWHAPEHMPRSYSPDNTPITIEQHDGFIRLIQPPEASTGIQKEIDIRLDPTAAQVELTHRLRNTGLWAVELAPWALSVMAQGGTAILPLPPFKPHTEEVRPAATLSLWNYTDLSDARWTVGSRFLLLRQDPARHEPQKIGVHAPDAWIAYARNRHLFVKSFDYTPGGRYPDMGCTIESFTDDGMLEIETLAALRVLETGAEAEHRERWSLFDGVVAPKNDADVARDIVPLVVQARV